MVLARAGDPIETKVFAHLNHTSICNLEKMFISIDYNNLFYAQEMEDLPAAGILMLERTIKNQDTSNIAFDVSERIVKFLCKLYFLD